MAFQAVDLSCIGFANGFTLWHYRTADGIFEVGKPRYFNHGAHLRFMAGDIIYLHAGAGRTDSFAQLVIVQADPAIGIVTAPLSATDAAQGYRAANPSRSGSAPITLGAAAF
jgi:hypothetical protein